MPIIRRIAEEVLGDKHLAGQLWKRMDVIGDIAILKQPQNIDLNTLRTIAEELVSRVPHIRSVWLAVSPVKGEYRVREKLLHLAGDRRTETIYSEHGCTFKVDIAKVFITPRLSYEHKRISTMVKTWETVTNMFAGAGLFSILIACHSYPAKVFSIDINPDAYKLMIENARINNVDHVVIPLLGDAAEIINTRLRGTSDRILMPLPELAIDYLPHAIRALRSGGIIHLYLHIHYNRGENPLSLAREEALQAALKGGAATAKIIGARKVRRVGPRTEQVVVDLRIR